MVKITWTKQALNDLDIICEFISKDSNKYAKIFVETVFFRTDQLEQFPESGRIVPELEKKEIRELIFGSYRIIYKINSNKIIILTIYHGARLLDFKKLKH